MIKILIKNLKWVFTNNLIVPPKEEWMKIAYLKIEEYNEPIVIDTYLNIDKITPQSLEILNPTPFDLNLRVCESLKKNIVVPAFSQVGVNIPSEKYRVYIELEFISKPLLLKPIELWINNFPIPAYFFKFSQEKKLVKNYNLSNGTIYFDDVPDYVKEVDITLVGGGAYLRFITYDGLFSDVVYLEKDMAYNFNINVRGIQVELDEGATGNVLVWW